jgi:hypothetical protein
MSVAANRESTARGVLNRESAATQREIRLAVGALPFAANEDLRDLPKLPRR